MKVLSLLLLNLLLEVNQIVKAGSPNDMGLCNLEASELGPDWYKVPQPVPTEFADLPDFERSFIHMPCPRTTVFDVAICGCTNLMSFLYSTIDGGKQKKSTAASFVSPTAPPGDWVKTVKPTTRPTPAGSLLLNTQTGEIRQCPFRASTEGPEWYLMHEPSGNWQKMRCAPGTLFYKKHCTCVHTGVYHGDIAKPEDADIVILEDETSAPADEKSISKALGISVSDVDFGASPKSDIPFWRRDKTSQEVIKPVDYVKPKPAVKIEDSNPGPVVDNVTIPLGKDAISQQHRRRLLKKGPIPIIRKEAASLMIDSAIDHNVRKVNVLNLETQADLVELDKLIENMKKEKSPQTSSKDFVGPDSRDQVIIFAHKECSKRPIPELGPQFFQLYIWGFGLVPYICNGNRVYDDAKCACVLAPRNATFDEVKFPVTECHKRAAKELGPKYFQMYQWGYGFTPYRCHRDLVFSDKVCACVKPTSALTT